MNSLISQKAYMLGGASIGLNLKHRFRIWQCLGHDILPQQYVISTERNKLIDARGTSIHT